MISFLSSIYSCLYWININFIADNILYNHYWFSNSYTMQANRICDRSLVKIYKDLMITKRDLIDLRESINNTLKFIKHSDIMIQDIETSRTGMLVCRSCGKYQSPAVPHRCAPVVLSRKCPHCPCCFPNDESLNIHKQKKHKFCGECKMIL